jgi:peptide/nickel transport system substrate-binding protein
VRVGVLIGCVMCGLIVGLALLVARDQRDLELELPALDHARPRPQGGFYVGATAEPGHLNLLTTSDAVARSLILRYTHDTLLEIDLDTGTLVPAVAEAVAVDDDGRALRVRLRPDVVFDDGMPLTLDDLEFVFRAAKAPGATFGSAGEAIAPFHEFTRLDERTCRLRAAQPEAHLRSLVGLTYPIVQARYWRRAIADLARAEGSTLPAEGSAEFSALLARVRLPGPGTGAYQLARERGTDRVAWRRGSELYLVQNPLSWRRRAQPTCWNLMGIGLRFLSDPAAQLAELRAGRLDWYAGDDAEAVFRADPALAQRMRLLAYRQPRTGHHMVIWNTRRKPYDDVRVRRALSMLFDRDAIVARLLGGHGQPAAAWQRPTDEEHPKDLAPMPFDLNAARTLLRQSGVVHEEGPPFAVVIYVANQLALQRRILELAVPAFAAAGLQLVIEQRDWSEVVQRYETRDFDAVLLIWHHAPGYSGPPLANFHSRYADPPGKNHSGLRDPAVDALLEATLATTDHASYLAGCHRLAHLLRELEPVSLLVHPRSTLLIDARFQDAEPCALGVVMNRFWVQR